MPMPVASARQEERGAGDLHALARRLLSPKTGLIKRLQVLPRYSGQIPLAHVIASMADYAQLPGGGAISQAGGSNFTVEAAFAQVLFEVLERYCAAIVDPAALVLSKPVSTRHLWGDRLPLYAPCQYEQPGFIMRRLTAESLIYWTPGRSLLDGEVRLIPASLVFLPYRPTFQDEWLGFSVSTGMAASWTWAAACLTGLMEVCERDAFTIMWMNRMSMPRLSVDDDPELARQLQRVLADRDASVTFVNLTNDYRVPVVLAVLESRLDGRRLVTVGMSSKRTFREAILKAFAEAVSDVERLREQLAAPGPRWMPAPDFSNVTDFEWHSLVYTHPEYQHHLDFLTASPIEQAIPHETERSGSPGQVLVETLREFERCGHDVVAVDLTTREVADLGVAVVKIVVPEAVPINPDHRFPPLGHRRLYEVPRRLGYRKTDSTVAELNPMPHPFA